MDYSIILNYIIQFVGAFISVWTAGIIIDIPRKYLVSTAWIGVIGWIVFLISMQYMGYNLIFSNYLSALTITFLAHIVARKSKTPVTVLLIPAIYTLVPGLGMYKTIFYLIHNNNVQFSENLKITLLIATMIAMAIFTADAVVKLYFYLMKKNQFKISR